MQCGPTFVILLCVLPPEILERLLALGFCVSVFVCVCELEHQSFCCICSCLFVALTRDLNFNVGPQLTHPFLLFSSYYNFVAITDKHTIEKQKNVFLLIVVLAIALACTLVSYD